MRWPVWKRDSSRLARWAARAGSERDGGGGGKRLASLILVCVS